MLFPICTPYPLRLLRITQDLFGIPSLRRYGRQMILQASTGRIAFLNVFHARGFKRIWKLDSEVGRYQETY